MAGSLAGKASTVTTLVRRSRLTSARESPVAWLRKRSSLVGVSGKKLGFIGPGLYTGGYSSVNRRAFQCVPAIMARSYMERPGWGRLDAFQSGKNKGAVAWLNSPVYPLS